MRRLYRGILFFSKSSFNQSRNHRGNLNVCIPKTEISNNFKEWVAQPLIRTGPGLTLAIQYHHPPSLSPSHSATTTPFRGLQKVSNQPNPAHATYSSNLIVPTKTVLKRRRGEGFGTVMNEHCLASGAARAELYEASSQGSPRDRRARQIECHVSKTQPPGRCADLFTNIP